MASHHKAQSMPAFGILAFPEIIFDYQTFRFEASQGFLNPCSIIRKSDIIQFHSEYYPS
jgi:hypothetical protein